MSLLFWAALTIVAGLISYHYLFKVRMQQDADWYGTFWESANLYVIPLATPMFFIGGIYGFVLELGADEDVVNPILAIPMLLSVLVGAIGILGGIGVPLPWPLVPKWVIERRKQDRNKRKNRR